MANETDRERVGNYELLDVIGEGGMGKVYRAAHPEIGRIVAIKVIRPELAGSEAVSARFFDEARAVNAIRHEGIVDIFDLGRRADGSTYYVMEHLVGEDLAHLAHREGPFPASVGLGDDHGLHSESRAVALPGARHPVNLYPLT